MSPLLYWLANHSGYTNLMVAILNLVIAVIIYRWKARVSQRGYKKLVFIMWLGQWFGFIVIFMVLSIIARVSPTAESQRWWSILLLCSVEVQTMFALAGGWLMLQGRDYQRKNVLISVGLLLVCLWLWDVFIGALFAETPGQRELWVFPSRILSMFAFLLLSVALFLRNKATAVPFLVVTFAYATAQLPVYNGTFVNIRNVSNWLTALAIGKLLVALNFYPAFLTARTSAPITLKSLVENKPRLSTYLETPVVRRIAKPGLWALAIIAEECIRRGVVNLFGYNSQ